MERQDTEDLINRLYRKLFYLPRTTLLSSVYIVEGLIASWLNIGSLKGSLLVILPTFIGFALYLTLIYVAFVAGAAVDSMKKALGIAVFSIAPYIIFASVDLPQPDSPARPSISPSLRSKVTSSTALTYPFKVL